MSLAGQRVEKDRYKIVPRTLSFLIRARQVLLIKLTPEKGTWSGFYNGVGGHVERGEDPLGSARREIIEETGITPGDLRLCGVVMIDASDHTGIGLYVFVGEALEGEPRGDREGTPEWVPLDALGQFPLLEDLPVLLPRAMSSYENGYPFSAAYSFDAAGNLQMRFSNGEQIQRAGRESHSP